MFNVTKSISAAALSVLCALSLGLSAAEAATITVPQITNTSATGIPAECGDGALAYFLTTSGVPLVTQFAPQSSASPAYAGLLVLAPNSAADPTNLATLNPIPQQGNFYEQYTVNNPSLQGSFSVQVYVAYSFVNRNGVTRYGVSQVPTVSSQQVTNHSLKGKSATFTYVANTDLAGQRATLQNLTGGATPGNQATNFQLLGIGAVIFNNGGTATGVNASFNNFILNSTNTNGNFPPVTGGANVPVGKATDQGANLNCASFIPSGVLPVVGQ